MQANSAPTQNLWIKYGGKVSISSPNILFREITTMQNGLYFACFTEQKICTFRFASFRETKALAKSVYIISRNSGHAKTSKNESYYQTCDFR
jgi:hypothetical protein